MTNFGEVCVKVKVTNFDTSGNAAMDNLADTAFREGGEYNHSEAQCISQQTVAPSLPLFQAEAESVELAVTTVIGKCQTRSL